MADQVKPADGPAAELITTLQNRINDLEARLVAEKDAREKAPKFERKEFDDAIALLKAELADIKREKAAVKKTEKELKAGDKPDDAPAETSDDFTKGFQSLSIFPDE